MNGRVLYPHSQIETLSDEEPVHRWRRCTEPQKKLCYRALSTLQLSNALTKKSWKSGKALDSKASTGSAIGRKIPRYYKLKESLRNSQNIANVDRSKKQNPICQVNKRFREALECRNYDSVEMSSQYGNNGLKKVARGPCSYSLKSNVGG